MGPGLLGALNRCSPSRRARPPSRTIRDGVSGAPLPDAVVTLTDVDRASLTDRAGRYRLSAVPSGPQHLSVKHIGYTPRTIHALVPGKGDLEIDFTLHPAPLQLPPIVVRSTVAVRGSRTWR